MMVSSKKISDYVLLLLVLFLVSLTFNLSNVSAQQDILDMLESKTGDSLKVEIDQEKLAKPVAGKQVTAVLKYHKKGTAGEKDVKQDLPYLIYLPQDYDKRAEIPMVLFLHGAGERGVNIEKVKSWGPPKMAKAGKRLPFIVVSPLCATGTHWNAQLPQLKALVDRVSKDFKVDTRRRYCTGLSMGGFGTWALCAKYPDLFAAAVPICGGGKIEMAKKLIDLPIWVFHGEADRVVRVQYSQNLVQGIKDAGGKKVKYTQYPGVNHNSWSRAYADKELMSWMLRQQRSTKSRKK